MIERPKRAVTRFFIPLIDVLILLFCIFLLMPIMNQPGSAEVPERPVESKNQVPDQLHQEIAGLQIDLAKARRELKKLHAERKDPSESVRVFVLDIDPKTGGLFYYRNGKHLDVLDQRAAEDLIDDSKRSAGIEKEPLFVLRLPNIDTAGFPTLPQLKKYHLWFKDVPHRFDSPLGILPPELEDKQ